ncbi:MAG: RuvX/YqgF family protein, partial [Solirubrobacteraceae bacterium]
MRVLALDYGSSRCGCAVSDPSGTIATPLQAVLKPGTRRGLGRLKSLVEELKVERIVVGLPLS